MNPSYTFSNVTNTYLNTYHTILDEMIQGMTEAKLSDSISYNFTIQMIPHHRAAIQMSKNLLNYTTNIPLQNIALQIISEQTKSIENMLQIQSHCKSLTNSKQDLYLYQRRMNQVMHMMFFEMENARSTNQINADFIREMIPHHEGAVKMSENTLQYEICPELKPILEAIITSQEKGIAQMQYLLQCME